MAVVERDTHAALGVELRGGGPVDIVGTDDAGAATDQGVGDAAVGISVTADRQHVPLVRTKTGMPGAALREPERFALRDWRRRLEWPDHLGRDRSIAETCVMSCGLLSS